MPIIPGTWKAEIRRIVVQGQPLKTVNETPISKITIENGLEVGLRGKVPAWQAQIPKFKSQSHQKKKKKKKSLLQLRLKDLKILSSNALKYYGEINQTDGILIH
jgi:hypothetical protein